MNRDNIFKSIDEKLTPSRRAEEELFERAGSIKSGEKYIGSAEEVFLSKGIIPESFESESSPARVRSRHFAAVAAAAAIALIVGAGAFFAVTSHKSAETDSTLTAQKKEESKTEIKSYTEVESDKPWVIIGQLIKNCYEEYDHMGGDYKSLPELKSFQELTSYVDLRIYIYDMYQNGEIDDKYVFIAENACSYEYYREKSDINNGLLKSETNPLIYFEYIDKEYNVSKNLSDYYPEDYEKDPSINPIKYLLDQLEGYGDDYKNKSEFSQLVKFGKDSGNYEQLITAMYIKGDVSDKGLEIAFEAAKEICVKSDNSDKVLQTESDIVALMTTEHYSKEMTETPKQRLVKDEDVNLWVKLKLQRIGSKLDGGYTTTGEKYDMTEDVNYISLKNLGSCTVQRTITDLYCYEELDGKDRASQAARQVIFDLGRGIGGDGAQTGDDVLAGIIGQAEQNCVGFDFLRGVCDGNYRESGDYLKNRDGIDELFAALAKLPADYNVTEKDITPVSDEIIAKQKQKAYAYLDLYDCYVPENRTGLAGNTTLSIIIPDKKENTLIVGKVQYKNLDKDLFEQIRLAVQDIVPPYGSKQEIKKYDKETFYPIPDIGGSKTYTNCTEYADKIYAFAGYIRDNYFGHSVGKNPTEIKENTSTAVLYDKDTKVCDIYVPDRYAIIANGGTELYIDGVVYKEIDISVIERMGGLIENETYHQMPDGE